MAEMNLKKKKLSVNLSYHNLTDSIKQNGANKSPKVFEGANGVVGLGILAALKCDRRRDRYEDPSPILAISPKYSSKPTPIIDFSRNGSNRKRGGGGGEEMDWREEYTCVISHVGDNLVRKREFFEGGNGNNDGDEMVFGVAGNGGGGNAAAEIGGFLDSCFLCKKTLDGLDIFMYSGEKAFCSDECRYRQISIDEQNEKCHSSGARNPLEHSASPCSATSRFFAGVAAA